MDSDLSFTHQQIFRKEMSGKLALALNNLKTSIHIWIFLTFLGVDESYFSDSLGISKERVNELAQINEDISDLLKKKSSQSKKYSDDLADKWSIESL